MKKVLFVFTAAAMLSACSSDETFELAKAQNPKSKMITYETSVTTRTPVTTINTLESFYVTAYLRQNDVISRYISDTKVQYTNGLWMPSQENAWPHSGKMTFFTCSPQSNKITYNFPSVADNKPAKPTFTYSVPSSEDEQLDVLYAVTEKDCADAYNASPETDGTVRINFRHALSQVRLSAKNTNPDWRVRITKVTLHNIKYQGTYTYPNQTTLVGNTVRGSWAVEDSKADYEFTFSDVTIDGEGTAELATTSTTKNNALLLMPQESAAWDVENDKSNIQSGAYFTITCNIVQVKEGVEVQLWPRIDKYEFGATKNVAIPASVKWEEGKCYTYNLKFGEGAGFIPPGETDGGTLIDGSSTLKSIIYDVTVSPME